LGLDLTDKLASGPSRYGSFRVDRVVSDFQINVLFYLIPIPRVGSTQCSGQKFRVAEENVKKNEAKHSQS
jgi:hypothetical protein